MKRMHKDNDKSTDGGKGDQSRTSNKKAYDESYDRIFGKKKATKKEEK